MTVADFTRNAMTSIQRADPTQRLVVAFSGVTLMLVIAMFGWWANRLQDTTDKLAEIQRMQAVELATLEQIVMQARRDIDGLAGRR